MYIIFSNTRTKVEMIRITVMITNKQVTSFLKLTLVSFVPRQSE